MEVCVTHEEEEDKEEDDEDAGVVGVGESVQGKFFETHLLHGLVSSHPECFARQLSQARGVCFRFCFCFCFCFRMFRGGHPISCECLRLPGRSELLQ